MSNVYLAPVQKYSPLLQLSMPKLKRFFYKQFKTEMASYPLAVYGQSITGSEKYFFSFFAKLKIYFAYLTRQNIQKNILKIHNKRMEIYLK